MKFAYNFIYAGQILLLLLMLIAPNGCNSSEGSPKHTGGGAEVKAVKVSVIEAAPTTIRDILVLPGETEAWQDVCVSADTGGRVEWIGPKEGETVEKGHMLAKVDVSALKTALDRAEAAFKLAEHVYKRRLNLHKKELIAKEELDRSRTERELALGNLRQAEIEYENGFIRSPIKGIVNHLYVDSGEFIDRGNPLADLVNVDRVRINVNVPELDVRYLEKGQKVLVTVDAFPERKVQGTVDFVSYKADPATKTFLVRVLIPNPGQDIRPGMIARVSFLRRIIEGALVVPIFALVDKGGERLLFVEENGVAHARSVSLGVIEGERIQITEGLKPGDHIIVTGQTQVEEGMRVASL